METIKLCSPLIPYAPPPRCPTPGPAQRPTRRPPGGRRFRRLVPAAAARLWATRLAMRGRLCEQRVPEPCPCALLLQCPCACLLPLSLTLYPSSLATGPHRRPRACFPASAACAPQQRAARRSRPECADVSRGRTCLRQVLGRHLARPLRSAATCLFLYMGNKYTCTDCFSETQLSTPTASPSTGIDLAPQRPLSCVCAWGTTTMARLGNTRVCPHETRARGKRRSGARRRAAGRRSCAQGLLLRQAAPPPRGRGGPQQRAWPARLPARSRRDAALLHGWRSGESSRRNAAGPGQSAAERYGDP